MAGQTLPEPSAQGDLERTPFAHLLLYIQRRALEGTLVVWRPEQRDARPRQDRVLFRRGAPVAARFSDPASRLDRGLLPLFARPSGPYAFYDVDLVGDGEGVHRGQVEVLPLIAASLRGSSRDDVARQVCAGFGDAPLRLERGADLDALGLLPNERALVELLRAEPMPIERLVEISPLPPPMAERLVYLLALTHSVAPWKGEPAPSSTPPRRARSNAPRVERPRTTESPARPSTLSDAHRALWDEIRARAASIEGENYFEMLGVPRDAPTRAVQKAYFNLVKRWHPDRLPDELSALRTDVEDIFQHLTRAQQILSDDATRGPYLASVQAGGGTPAAERKVAAIVQAAVDFRKVEVMVRRREFDGALALLDAILAVSDDEPDYHAMRGWIVFQQHPGDAEARALVLASLERALALNPAHDKAHYYKGMVLDRAGQSAEAAACFRRAAELNPKNIEAVRMVRIAEMRGGDARRDGSQGRDSLIGKLFGTPKKK